VAACQPSWEVITSTAASRKSCALARLVDSCACPPSRIIPRSIQTAVHEHSPTPEEVPRAKDAWLLFRAPA
jgi:hypothetical protein